MKAWVRAMGQNAETLLPIEDAVAATIRKPLRHSDIMILLALTFVRVIIPKEILKKNQSFLFDGHKLWALFKLFCWIHYVEMTPQRVSGSGGDVAGHYYFETLKPRRLGLEQ